MANKPLTTTVIGSFPKPSYLPIEDWFDGARNDGGTERVTKEFTQYIEKKSDSDEVINLQIDAGIDIPTDGEVRRENYIHYHCRYLEGFDFKNLEHRILRDGAYETNLPAVRNKIKHNGSSHSDQRQLNLHFRDHLRLWIQRQIVSMTTDQSSIAI